ncbi:MAG: AmmeMemoRadiSam system protein B, partial [Anaerolineae bacterium]
MTGEMTSNRCPKLRDVDARPIICDGQVSILLRDPLRLTDQSVVIPRALAPLLMLCDGTREVEALRTILALEFGVRIQEDVLTRVVSALDDAFLLDNERFAQACQRTMEAYRAAPFRSPTLAGQSYPEDAADLSELLDTYLLAVDDQPRSRGQVVGLISPHIDFNRGGPTYAPVWGGAAAAVQEADLVVILGTDHYGADGTLTLTRQHYATPYGVLPTSQDAVEEVARAVGGEIAFGDELNHRTEHSIELAAVWLHHVRGGAPCELLPILCGSFGHFVETGIDPADDRVLDELAEALRQLAGGQRVVLVAAGDLAHVGPAFGGRPQGQIERERLRAADDVLIEHVCAGDAA